MTQAPTPPTDKAKKRVMWLLTALATLTALTATGLLIAASAAVDSAGYHTHTGHMLVATGVAMLFWTVLLGIIAGCLAINIYG